MPFELVEPSADLSQVESLDDEPDQAAAAAPLHPLLAGLERSRDQDHGQDAKLEITGVPTHSCSDHLADEIASTIQLLPEARSQRGRLELDRTGDPALPH